MFQGKEEAEPKGSGPGERGVVEDVESGLGVNRVVTGVGGEPAGSAEGSGVRVLLGLGPRYGSPVVRVLPTVDVVLLRRL